MKKDEKQQFDELKIPNDFKVLGELWNYCELASDKNTKSLFVKKLDAILQVKDLYQREEVEETGGLLSLFKRSK